MVAKSSGLKKVVFVLWSNDSGIFVEADAYDRDTKIHVALENANTWAEFKQMLPAEEFSRLHQWWCNDGHEIFEENGTYSMIMDCDLPEFMETIGEEGVVHATDKFDAMKVWGVGDGDYPGLHNNTCDGSFPDEFRKKFGNPVSSMVSGSWTEYPVDKLEEMTFFLNSLGIEVAEDLSMEPQFNCL